MVSQSANLLTLVIYFAYGLAFFGMGITMALESSRSPFLVESRQLQALAAFGILHGIHEWFEAYLLQHFATGYQFPEWILWLRFIILATSFTFLLLFGLLALYGNPPKSILIRVSLFSLLSVYGLFILSSAIYSYRSGTTLLVNVFDVLSRYILAVPASILAAVGLHSESLQEDASSDKSLRRLFSWAAFGFILYSVTQLFVPAIDMFPARLVNSTAFLKFAGFPIQAVRAVIAVFITFCLVRAAMVFEKIRQRQLMTAQQDRLIAMEQVHEELTKRENLRKRLLRHTVQTQEEERARIARELHDETSQILTAFSLDLATLKSLADDRKDLLNLVNRLQSQCKEISSSLYRLVHDLRPAQLDDLGLLPALEYLKDFNTSKGLEVDLSVQGTARRLDPIVETVLFRVAQEAFNNIQRHAKVEHAKLQLTFKSQEVILRIEDSGVGFNPVENFSPPRGWGLAGMTERVDSLGGELLITSEPGKGTIVEAEIPVYDIIP